MIILLLATIFLETLSLSAAYINLKKGIPFDNKIKSILVFNLISVLLIPVMLYFAEYPLVFTDVNKDEIFQLMQTDGVIAILKDANVFGFLLYQVLGILIALVFIIYTFMGGIHIWSMINLSIHTKGEKIWRFIYRKTYTVCKGNKMYIGMGTALLFISFIMVSGLLFSWIV